MELGVLSMPEPPPEAVPPSGGGPNFWELRGSPPASLSICCAECQTQERDQQPSVPTFSKNVPLHDAQWGSGI
jgi:hypothetical protein